MRAILIFFMILLSNVKIYANIDGYESIIKESLVRDTVREVMIELEIKHSDSPKDVGLIYCLGTLYSIESTMNDEGLEIKGNELVRKGIETANEKLRLEGQDFETYYYLAYFYKHQGNNKEMLNAIYRSINLNRHSIYSYLLLAKYYADNHMYKISERLYKKIIKLNAGANTVCSAYIGLGDIYEAKKEIEKAKSYWETAIKIDPAYIGVYSRLYDYYKKHSRFREFIGILLNSIDKVPYTPKLYIYLAFGYENLGMKTGNNKYFKLAIFSLNKALTLTNNNITKRTIYLFLFNNYIELGNWRKAIMAFYNAKAFGYRESNMDKIQIAECYIYLKEFKVAEDILLGLMNNQAAKMEVPLSYLYSKLVTLYIEEGEIEKAFYFAKERMPEKSTNYRDMGDVYFSVGKYIDAIKKYKKSLSLLTKDAEYIDSIVYKTQFLTSNVLYCYRKIKNCHEALANYEMAMEYEKKIKEILQGKPFRIDFGNILNDTIKKQITHIDTQFNRDVKQNPSNASVYKRRGRIFYHMGLYKEAIRDFKKALEIDPKCANAYNNLGSIYYDLRKYKKAIKYLKLAIYFNPDNYVYYNNLGIVYSKRSHYKTYYKKALKSYIHALTLNYKYSNAYYNLGLIYDSQRQYEKAIDRYKQAVNNSPKFATAYYNMGVDYNRLRMYKRAIKSYKNTIRSNLFFEGAYINLGVVYGHLGLDKEAISIYKRLVNINPFCNDAYYNLGIVCDRLRQYERAIKFFWKAIYLNPIDSTQYCGLGLAYYKSGKYKDAIDAYKKAISINWDYAEAYYNLGLAYLAIADYKEAAECLKQAIYIKPNYPEAYCSLGIAYKNLKQIEDAIETYKKAIQIKSDYADAFHNLGVAYRDVGQFDEAIGSFRKAIFFKPDFPEALYNLGYIYYQKGSYELAIEMYKQTISVKPDYADVYYNLGLVYGKIGQFKEAIESLKQFIDFKPDNPTAHHMLGMAYLLIGDSNSAMGECEILKKLNKESAEQLLREIKTR